MVIDLDLVGVIVAWRSVGVDVVVDALVAEEDLEQGAPGAIVVLLEVEDDRHILLDAGVHDEGS